MCTTMKKKHEDINQLKAVLTAERTGTKEAEPCLAQQVEETSKIKAVLVQTEKELEQQKCQWEQASPSE